MERPVVVVVLVALSSAILAGCGGGDPRIAVLQGNYAFSRGEFQTATIHYLRAVEQFAGAEGTGGVAYNIGNVYHSLGEPTAALAAWQTALTSDDSVIRYGTWFNRGVLLYELGHYTQAGNAFAAALSERPGSLDAKVNLELCLRKIQARQASTSGNSTNGESSATSETLRVLEYVKRQEEQTWTGSETPVSDASQPEDW